MLAEISNIPQADWFIHILLATHNSLALNALGLWQYQQAVFVRDLRFEWVQKMCVLSISLAMGMGILGHIDRLSWLMCIGNQMLLIQDLFSDSNINEYSMRTSAVWLNHISSTPCHLGV